MPKDLWFCYYCQEIRAHKGSECKDGRLKSKVINNDNIKPTGKLDRQGITRIRNNVNSKPADILIDGKGDLLLYTNQDNKIIKISNVISAKDVSDNLLALRKLVDKGFKIYLDDKILRVFSENLEEIILEGIYENPTGS